MRLFPGELLHKREMFSHSGELRFPATAAKRHVQETLPSLELTKGQPNMTEYDFKALRYGEVDRVCVVCGKSFIPTARTQKYCSQECQRYVFNANRRAGKYVHKASRAGEGS